MRKTSSRRRHQPAATMEAATQATRTNGQYRQTTTLQTLEAFADIEGQNDDGAKESP